jgi:hypothetical protein
VSESAIVYADAGAGSDGAGCGSRAEPCASVAGALSEVTASRSTIKLLGSEVFGESLELDGVAVTVVGPGTMNPPEDDTPVLRVQGGADLELEEVTLTGATTGASADGLRCDASTVSLVDSAITDNAADGIDSDNCTVTVQGSEVRGNQGIGVSATGGTLTVQGSEVRGNFDGGILLSGGAALAIRNNMIVGNGLPDPDGSELGGVQIGSSASSDVFAFNTVARNSAGEGVATGINCISVGEMIAAGNIVHDGDAGGEALAAENCRFAFSNVQGLAPLADGNIDADPLFVNVSEGDFHLLPDSPCIDAADPASTVDVDIDGDARPQGAAADMGADEVVR